MIFARNITIFTLVFLMASITLSAEPIGTALSASSATTSAAASGAQTANGLDQVRSQLMAQMPKRINDLRGLVPNNEIDQANQFAQALTLMAENQDDEAQELLKKIGNNSALHAYVNHSLAKIYIKKKQAQKALPLVPINNNPDKKIELEQFWQRQHIYALMGNCQNIDTEIASLTKMRPKDKWVAIKGNYFKGLCAFLKNDSQNANEFFRAVVVSNPGTQYDQKIFALAGIKDTAPNGLLSREQWNTRAENLIEDGFPMDALAIWQAFFKTDKTYEEAVARGFFKARKYREAATAYSALWASGNHKAGKDEILSLLAQSYARHDNFDMAKQKYQELIRLYPKSRFAGIAKNKLGFVYFDSGDYKKTIEYLTPFINQGSNYTRDRAHWFVLWSHYLTGNYQEALAQITAELEKKKAGRDKRNLLEYWQARILEKLGDPVKSKAIYRKLAMNDPIEYYALLSRQRLKYGSLAPKTLISPTVLSFVPSNNANKSSVPVKTGALTLDTPATAALLLWSLGLDNFAFDESQHSALKSFAASFDIAKLSEAAGNFNNGYALRKLATAGKLPGASESDGYMLAFPRAYSKYISPFARQWGIDEFLAYAVMRQESAFIPEALSYAAAYGLMQIIPPTGAEIASAIGYDNFHVEQLNRPDVNTLFGTWYLKHLLDLFGQNPVYAMGAYNAGPDAMKRWTAKASKVEADEFIELIPYAETSNYVKKVLVNYLVYDRLYR